MDEREVLQLLRRYNSIVESIEILKERLAMKGYQTTPSYSLTAGGGGWAHSKVEDFSLSTVETKDTIRELQETIRTIDNAIDNTLMTDDEKTAILYTIEGMPLSVLAKRKGIYMSNIYKIRDSGVKKLTKTLNNAQKGGFIG